MSKKGIFVLAIFVYFLISPLTYHPDIKTIFYLSQFLSKGILNIYSYLETTPSVAQLGQFVYPPLAYIFYGILFVPVKFIAGEGFSTWLAMGNDEINHAHIFRYLFLMKLPGILFLLLTGYLLSSFIKDEKQGRLALILWFFNPVSLYVVGLMGQIDIVPTFITFLSLFYLNKNPYFSAFFLGLGASFKTYPLILIPYTSLLVRKTWKHRLLISICGFLTFIFLIFPFVKTPAFYHASLVSGLTKRIFELKMSVGFEEYILILPTILFLLLILSSSKKFGETKKSFVYFFGVTFYLFSGLHFHPQWAMWSIPFLILSVLDFVLRKEGDIVLSTILFFLGWIGVLVLYDDKFLTWGILSPLDPGVLFLPTLSSFLKPFVEPNLLKSVFHSLILTSGSWVFLRSLINNAKIK